MNKQHINFIHNQNGDIDYVETNLKGLDLIRHPILNKATAFTQEERYAFLLHGYLPEHVESLDEQVDRSYLQLKNKGSDIEKYIYLNELNDSNTTLFYALSQKYIDEIMPLIYTPTVGQAVESFSHIVRRPQGIYLSYPNKDKIHSIFEDYHAKDIDFIIVTDGEAILGIGDQGVGGIDISIGKLMVYIICGGLNPARVLPIQIDVGTNNEKLLKDPQYLGWRNKRVTGEGYDSFIETFVEGVKKYFPKAYLHWEDFGRDNAHKILEKYRDKLCTFNDDIQGTGIVATANILSGCHASGIPLEEQKIIMFGAGTAGCGIADQICDLMEYKGISREDAHSKIYLIDRKGLVHEGLSDVLPFQKPYSKKVDEISQWGKTLSDEIYLDEVVKFVKPTALIGCSAVKGAFSENIVKEMAKHVERPTIMPLSNPNSRSEAEPQDLINWTDGKALIAAGSPYPTPQFKGKAFPISQGNNAFIFPGLGLGSISVRAKRVTPKMILKACLTLSSLSPLKSNTWGTMLPPVHDIKKISHKVALEVARQAIKDNVSTFKESDVENLVNAASWHPRYYSYKSS